MTKPIKASVGDQLIVIGGSVAAVMRDSKNRGLKLTNDYSETGADAKKIADILVPGVIESYKTKTGFQGEPLFKTHVVIDTGWSNSLTLEKPTFELYVAKQIKILKQAGAKSIIMLGVASNYQSANKKLNEKAYKTYGPSLGAYMESLARVHGVHYAHSFVSPGKNVKITPPASYFDASPAMQTLASEMVGAKGQDLSQPKSTPILDSLNSVSDSYKSPVAPNKEKDQAEAIESRNKVGSLSTMEEMLEYVSDLPKLIKQRANISRARDGDSAKPKLDPDLSIDDYVFNYNVENLIKGLANTLDMVSSSGYKSLSWLKADNTLEDMSATEKLNHEWINSFSGYSYQDLKLEEAFGEDAESLRKVRPTFFLESQPLINKEMVEEYISIASSRGVNAIKNIARRTILDEVFETSIETNALNEADEFSTIGRSNMSSLLEESTQDMKERRYIPVDGVLESSTRPTQTFDTDSSGYPVGNTGSDSNYKGEFPPEIKKWIGSLQASQGLGILQGHPPGLRAIADLISRHEGTHEAKGHKGYGEYFNHSEEGRALMQRSMRGEIGHPNLIVKGSSAAGRYQGMGKGPKQGDSWRDVNKRVLGKKGLDGQGDVPMTIKNQDDFFIGQLKARGLYDSAAAGDIRGFWEKIRGKHRKAWTSVPYELNSSKAAQVPEGRGLTGAQWIQAAEILKNFYSQMKVDGAPPEQTQRKTNITPGRANIESIIKPDVLEASMDNITFDTPPMDEALVNSLRVGQRLSGYKLVGVLYGDTIFVEKGGKGLMIKIDGIIAPKVRAVITHKGMGFLNTDRPTIYGSNEFYGRESRKAVDAMLDGKSLNFMVISVNKDLFYSTVTARISYDKVEDFGTAALLWGLARPLASAGNKYKSYGDQAQKEKKGLWAYQSTVVNGTGYTKISFHQVSNNATREVIDEGKKAVNNSNSVLGGSVSGSFKAAKTDPMKPPIAVTDAKAQAMGTQAAGAPVRVTNLKPTDKPMILISKESEADYRAKKRSGKNSGYCLSGVKFALQLAGYTKDYPSLQYAYQAHTTGFLKNMGFSQIDVASPLQLGDIMVYRAAIPGIHTKGGKVAGHIQIYKGSGKWFSDVVSNTDHYPGVAKDLPSIALYRDKNHLNGAKVMTSNDWQPKSRLSGKEEVSAFVSGALADDEYKTRANLIGVYPDMSAYSPSQIRGHDYTDVDFGVETVRDQERFTVYSNALRKEKYAEVIAHNYSKGLDVCFPVVKAYAIIGNEDDDLYTPGMPLTPAIYYELPPIQSFHLETNNDFNPLDVCTFGVINPSSVRSLADQHADIGLAYDPAEINTQYYNPTLLSKLRLLPGMKIHIRAGYSNDPNKLIPVFNGTIKHTSGALDRVIECVCESYANELLAQQLGYKEPIDFSGDHNASTGLLLAYSLMSSNITHFGAVLGNARVASAWVNGVVKGMVQTGWSVLNPTNWETVDDLRNLWSAAKEGDILGVATSGVDAIATPASFLFGGPVVGALVMALSNMHMLSQNGAKNSPDDEAMSYFASESSPFKGLLLGGKGREGDFRDPENKALVAPMSGGGLLWNMFNPSRANLCMRLFQNIYSDNIEQVHDTFRDTVYGRYFRGILDWDVKFLYRFYVYRSTAWTVMKEMEYRHPGTLAKPLLYEERMTMFYGIKDQLYIARDLDPMFMLRAAFQNRHENASKPYSKAYLKQRHLRMEPATGYHFLSTQTNIISNNLKLNRDFATKTTAVYYEAKYFGMAEAVNKKSETIILSPSLAKFDIKESVVELGGCHGSYMSWLYATQELKKQLEKMYEGTIVVTGDPTIRAGDHAYLFDADRSLRGTIKIREASHHFSPTDGYVTIITPALYTEATHFFWDDYILKLHLAASIMNATVGYRQDLNLASNELFERYQAMLEQMGRIKDPSGTDLMFSFGAWALLAGLTVGGLVMTLRFFLKTLGTNVGGNVKIAQAYTRALGSYGWRRLKVWRRYSGMKMAAASEKVHQAVLKQMAQQTGRSVASTSKLVKRLQNSAKAARVVQWATKGPGLVKKAWTATSFIRTFAMGAGVLAASNPVTVALGIAITVAVNVVMGWATSAVRRAQLTHNPVSFFPLESSGDPFLAGVTGFSDRGHWEAFKYNWTRNMKILAKAGRAMEQQGTFPDGNQDVLKSKIGKAFQWIGATGLESGLAVDLEENLKGGMIP